jgi:hypothetical protein
MRMPQTNKGILKFLQKNGFDIVELVFNKNLSLYHPTDEASGIDYYEGWYRSDGGYEAVELHIKDYDVVGILVYDASTGEILGRWGKIWDRETWKLF